MKHFILFVLIFFLFSCSDKEKPSGKIVEIDIENAGTHESPEIKLKSLIPIETTDSTLFGHIGAIEYYAGKYYLLDMFVGNTLLAFDENGRFLNKTKIGKGPDEMVSPYAMYIDKEKENIVVWDEGSRQFVFYDLNLNILSREEYGALIQNFAFVNDGEILVHSNFYRDYFYTLYSGDSIVERYLVDDMQVEGVQGIIRPINKRNRTLVISPFDYNVYQLNGHSLQSILTFDFGKYNFTKNELKEEKLGNIWELINKGLKASSPFEIAESENFLLFKIYYNESTLIYFYSFKSGKVYCINEYFTNGILPKCDIRGTTSGDTFYGIVTPEDMIEFQKTNDKKLVDGNIDLEQNPFIINIEVSE